MEEEPIMASDGLLTPVTHLVGDDRSGAARRRGFPATGCSVVKGWSRQQRTTEPLLCFDDTPLPARSPLFSIDRESTTLMAGLVFAG
ncbi:hypothetical protein Hdeb2414_s0002g00071111 [Helianthus debilis subsp. tardiflorus]